MTGLLLAEQAARELGETFVADTVRLLLSLGYPLKLSDDWFLGNAIERAAVSIKTDCNAGAVPVGLRPVAVELTAGHFLFALKSSGQLTGYNFDAAVKQIAEGDTSVTYALDAGSLTPEQRFDALLAYLIGRGKAEIAAYRQLRW